MPTWRASTRPPDASSATCRRPGTTPKPALCIAASTATWSLNTYPYTSGHVMIVPFAHLDELQKLPVEAAHEMMDLGQKMERVLRQPLHPGRDQSGNEYRQSGRGWGGRTHPSARAAALGGRCQFHDGRRAKPESCRRVWRRPMEGSRGRWRGSRCSVGPGLRPGRAARRAAVL